VSIAKYAANVITPIKAKLLSRFLKLSIVLF